MSRLGGDEFAIILPEIQSLDEAIAVAQNIQQEINFPFKINNREFLTSGSIGIALSRYLDSNICYTNASDLLRDADIAMYKAKSKGKNSYQVFGIAMYENLLKKLKLESELRQAIAEKSLTAYYQPIINLQTGKLASIESLVRWWHPELGFLPPNKFLPVAEDSGLMKDLGTLILKLSCVQLYLWQEQNLIDSDVSMSVNLAGQQFGNHDLVAEIENILAETKLSTQNLCLEVTETIIGENIIDITSTLKKIRKMGVKIAIDDFGTGYSSLSRLWHFPADRIKIDKAFIQQLTIDLNNTKFLSGIISLCHNLDFEVVCEGIETQTELDIVTNLNSNYGQGFFFAKPMNSEDFEVWIRQQQL